MELGDAELVGGGGDGYPLLVMELKVSLEGDAGIEQTGKAG